MRWLDQRHGLRTEPSGAVAVAALLSGRIRPNGNGDLVLVVSGRNADEVAFRDWIAPD
jgi:threonine dehydratase